MISVIHQSTPVARKSYVDDAWLFLEEGCDGTGMTFAEKRVAVRYRQNGGMIQKGEKYVRQFNTDGDHTWTYRSNPLLHAYFIRSKAYKRDF